MFTAILLTALSWKALSSLQGNGGESLGCVTQGRAVSKPERQESPEGSQTHPV